MVFSGSGTKKTATLFSSKNLIFVEFKAPIKDGSYIYIEKNIRLRVFLNSRGWKKGRCKDRE